jgi:hypothetical protein
VSDPILVLRRFIHADDRITDESNIQTYNRFAYCTNNPLKYTDPTGHETVPGTDAAIQTWWSNASLAYGTADMMGLIPPAGPPQLYPLQGEFLDRYNAEWQVINNTQPSAIPSAPLLLQGPGVVDPGPELLTSESLGAAMMNAAHTFLDGVGTVEGVGTVADLGNAALYAWEGDYKNAGWSLAAAAPLVGAAATITKWGRKTLDVGTTVLGSYDKVTGGYVSLAKQLDARYFEIPTPIWNGMTDAERWTANTKFLDRTIMRQDNIILSNSAFEARQGTSFYNELQYLYSKGYTPAPNGMSLIKSQ